MILHGWLNIWMGLHKPVCVCVCICVHENTRTDAFGLKSMEIICIQPILLLLLVLLDWILQIIFAQRVAGGWGGDMNINDNSQWIFPMKIFSKHAIFVFFSLNSPSLATSWAIFSLSIRNNLSLFCIVVTVSLDFFFLSFCTYFVLEKKRFFLHLRKTRYFNGTDWQFR